MKVIFRKCGRVRLNALVLKTKGSKGSVSSNLTASAKLGELGELVETTFLLRRHTEQKLCIEGSNPSLSAKYA